VVDSTIFETEFVRDLRPVLVYLFLFWGNPLRFVRTLRVRFVRTLRVEEDRIFSLQHDACMKQMMKAELPW